MNTKINGLAPLSTTPDAVITTPKRNSEGAEPASAVRLDDRLELTSSARLLSETASGSDNAPVDAQRVERLRASIASGTYRIDAARIADRLLEASGKTGKAG